MSKGPLGGVLVFWLHSHDGVRAGTKSREPEHRATVLAARRIVHVMDGGPVPFHAEHPHVVAGIAPPPPPPRRGRPPKRYR